MTPKKPSTDVMRSCAAGHRTLANTYAMDISEGAEMVAQGSLLTALLLEAAADFIDANHPEKVGDAPAA